MTKESEQEPKQAKPKQTKGKVVVNNRKNPVRIAGVSIDPKGSVELTPEQTKDERLMAKIEHGVKTGVYSYGK